MSKLNLRRSGVTNIAFAGTVVVLVVLAGIGYGLYGTSVSAPSKTVTVGMTETNMMTETTTQMMTATSMGPNASYQFTPASGAMITNAWLVTVPLGMGMNDYAVSIHAEGLEVNSTYVVEAAQSSGSMATVLISSQSMNMNTTAGSEFQTDKSGTGLYWIELVNNPTTAFENVQLYLVPSNGMMNETTLVATATFAMSH